MNERYTYGYDMGWNVENEYINSLNGIMEEYNAQSEKLSEPYNIDGTTNAEIDLYGLSKITEEDIKQWYQEDYGTNNVITYERYKNDVLESIKAKQKDLYKEAFETIKTTGMSKTSDEYYANLYNLIKIKDNTRILVNKKRNELQLLLSEKKIELSSINLEQQKLKPQYGENGNVINFNELSDLRRRYDEVWLEIRKIEHALEKVEEMYKKLDFTVEETKLMMKGLSPSQREIYNNLIKTDEPEVLENNNVDENLMSVDPTFETDEIVIPTDSNNDEIEEDIIETIDEEPIAEMKQDVSNIQSPVLKEIVDKVCGNNDFTAADVRKYNASNIKVFEKPQKGNFKISSISKAIVGIIPRAAMKLYGKNITEDVKNNVADMQTRAMSLTDEEVEQLLSIDKKEFKNAPKGFTEIVKPRVNLYLSGKIDALNEKFNKKLFEIEKCKEIIANEEDQELVNQAYEKASSEIKGFIELQLEVASYSGNPKLHSFQSQLKALKSKLDYAGSRFVDARDYDSSLWSKVSGLSQKVEYSLNDKEVVDSYIERERVYKEYNRSKDILPEKYVEQLNEIRANYAKNKQENNEPSKKSVEVRSLIESLKAIKAEITEQDVKEIEDLLKSR